MRGRYLAFTILFAIGCGGSFESAGGDAGRDAPARDGHSSDGGGTDGSADAPVDSTPDAPSDSVVVDAQTDGGMWSPDCPTGAPAIGTHCTIEELQCEYPEEGYPLEYEIQCDRVRTCTKGLWADGKLGFGSTCRRDGPNSPGCPAKLSDVKAGASCPSDGLRCEYKYSGVCWCEVSIGGPPPPPDAGPMWICAPPPLTGCPMPRPRLGSACSTTSTSCDYEPCEYSQSCTDGVWHGAINPCA